MEFRELEMLLAIVEQGGFNKAAAALHISQSAISRKIDLLEAELGQKLFLRLGNHVVLTPVGEALAQHSRCIFRQLKLARMELSDITELREGKLSIGASVGACIYLLPPVLKKFHQEFPNIQLKVVVSGTDELIPQIRDGRIDLGLLTLPVVSDGLTVTRFYAEELVVIVGHDHPWASRKQIKADELTQFPFIIIEKESKARHILEGFFHSAKVLPRIEMELPNFSTIKPLVEINLGISIAPLGEVAKEVEEHRLHVLRIKGIRLERELGLVYLKAENTPRIIATLIQSLVAVGNILESGPAHRSARTQP
jgi:DNA-binding transcriptional LysR family regulator